MTTTKKTAALGLLLASLLAACCEPADRGVVKSLHTPDKAAPFAVCQSGHIYQHVILTEAVIKHVKEGDPCPDIPSAPVTTTDNGPRKR